MATREMTHLEILTHITSLFKKLEERSAPADSEVPDVLGVLRALEIKFGEWRRGLISETPEVEGVDFEIVETRRNKYSFGTAAIMQSAMSVFDTPMAAIMALLNEGAATLKFGKTALDKFFQTYQLSMRIENVEIADTGDADGPHLGKVVVIGSKQQPLKPKDGD